MHVSKLAKLVKSKPGEHSNCGEQEEQEAGSHLMTRSGTDYREGNSNFSIM